MVAIRKGKILEQIRPNNGDYKIVAQEMLSPSGDYIMIRVFKGRTIISEKRLPREAEVFFTGIFNTPTEDR